MNQEAAEDIYLDTAADEAQHHPYCPMGIAASKGRRSTLCFCIELIAAELCAKAEHYADTVEDR